MPFSPLSSLAHRFAALTLACVSLGACSTLTQGTSQQVAITTPGADRAVCHLTGGDGVSATVTTPGTVRLPKSKKDINVACDAPGLQPASGTLKSTYSKWSVVEYPLGYPVDAISGAMWVYPETFAVPFGSGGQQSQTSGAATFKTYAGS